MNRSRRRALATTAALAPITLVVVACSGQGSVEAPDVRTAATAFVRTASADPGSACALLAPVTAREVADDAPCAAGLADAGLPPAGEIRSVQVTVRVRGRAGDHLLDPGRSGAEIGRAHV